MLQQNFEAAIADWETALGAPGHAALQVDANYWIADVKNTLGRFEEVGSYLRQAIAVSPEDRKVELTRLEIETRFFSLGLAAVPESLLLEGREYLTSLSRRASTPRSISSFCTTLGNIAMVKAARTELRIFVMSLWTSVLPKEWFEKALSAEPKSRWARFGIVQCKVLSEVPLTADDLDNASDVIRSVKNEYQNRVEEQE